ncbi:MAG: class I tRNA ligase family protein, partial [Gimesia sp.]
AQSAIDAVEDGRVRFFPSRYSKTYLDWLKEKRDWCISRQLWWGHQIPIWYCDTCSEDDLKQAFDDRYDVSYRRDDEDTCWLICSETDLAGDELGTEHQLTRDEDVLDTWFSSALWPHATLGWPEKNPDLDYFYPGSVLITSRDIITLWVARMVLAGLYNLGDIPFKHVCIHPKILDGFGQTMSKSKGNGVDPMDLIDKYGVDAVRFTITSLAGETQDVRLPVGYEDPETGEVVPQTLEHQTTIPGGGEKPRIKFPKSGKSYQYTSPWFDPDPGEKVARIVSERFEYGRNFCNKLWNASRFAMLNLEGYTPAPLDENDLTMEDRWILSRLSSVAEEMTTVLNRYQFDVATRAIRDFTWNEFCDWYLEMIKPRLWDEKLKPVAQRVLVGVLDSLLRLLQPFVPFIAEELWQRLNEIAPERGLFTPETAVESVTIAAWPEPPQAWQDPSLEKRFERLQEMIVAVRNIRAVYKISPATPLKLFLRCEASVADDMQNVASQFDNLAKTLLESAGADVQRPSGSATFSLNDVDGFISLEGVIDLEAELERLQTEADKVKKHIEASEKKLANKSFVDRAPADVVTGVKETLGVQQKKYQTIQETIVQLRGK